MKPKPCATKFLSCITFLCIFLSCPASGHEQEIPNDIGITEMIGDTIPGELSFRDETGAVVTLAGLLNKPAILIPVYFGCDHYCPQTLGALATTLADLKFSAGRDYQLITFSFDENDDAVAAQRVRYNYIKAAGEKFPEGAWRFLTGNKENIASITEAIGFHYQRDSHGFVHPVVLVFLSADRQITGYHYVSVFRYGVRSAASFSPADIEAGINNACKGTPSLGVMKSTLYCFPHQPAGHNRFFRLLGITGGVTIFSLIFFVIYLKTTSRRFSSGNKKSGRN